MSWFLQVGRRADPRVRVFCFPWAGVGSAVYRRWPDAFDGDVEVLPIQLPGRGWRFGEPPLRDLNALADQVTEVVTPLCDRPFVIFGHSMGSWLGLLVGARLERAGLVPEALLASGRQGPASGALLPPMSHMDDDTFLREMQARYAGIPAEVQGDPELLSLVLPALRADIEAMESYRHRPGAKLSCPVTAIGGEDDPMVPVRHLVTWADETTGPFAMHTTPGGHFHLETHPQPVWDLIRAATAAVAPGPRAGRG